ncbi:MAG: hypothetical protein V3V88_01065 [Dehalococcoidia bacterium]
MRTIKRERRCMMSHVTVIEMEEEYTLPVLRQMCKDQGWEWLEGQRTYRWYNQFMGDYPLPVGFTRDDLGRCDHAIRIPGASYEIGVVKKGGEWKLLWDFWKSGGLQQKLGRNAGLLKRSYGMAKTRITANKHRKRCYQRPVKQKGWTKLVVEI